MHMCMCEFVCVCVCVFTFCHIVSEQVFHFIMGLLDHMYCSYQ